MAVKFRHKETGMFFCKAKGLSNDKKYGEYGSRERFLNRHLSKCGRIYESATEKQKSEWIGKRYSDEFEIVVV
nr:MAG TPA: hypothetical protein [Caudoviricetes sp.]